MQAQLNEILVAQSSAGKRLIVVIDETQNLNYSVLEAVRMLSNFETASNKLMQIILTGQPQLAEKLKFPDLLQLRQRISIFGKLEPLSAIETRSYIHHRLRIAGYDSREPLFTAAALELIARYSEGLPRNINNICFNALSLGYALERRAIDTEIIKEVIADLGMIRREAPMEAREVVFYEKRRPVEIARPTVKPKRSTFQLPFKTAVAWVFLLALAWLAFQTSFADDSPRAASTANPPVLALRSHTRLIEAQEGQSLYQICAQTFGGCRPAMLREIVTINSTIHDPNHIKPGQKLSVPIPVPASAKGN
jgi:hypothetical protein